MHHNDQRGAYYSATIRLEEVPTDKYFTYGRDLCNLQPFGYTDAFFQHPLNIARAEALTIYGIHCLLSEFFLIDRFAQRPERNLGIVTIIIERRRRKYGFSAMVPCDVSRWVASCFPH